VKTATTVDYVVIAAYMALMLAIGLYSARFNRGASDYFKGGNRIPWLVAGLSCFMSGFSAWTFTGAAGLAYGPPALLGLVVKRTPSWSGMASFVVGLALGGYGAFVASWTLVQNVAIIVPASMAVFFATAVFEGRDAAHPAYAQPGERSTVIVYVAITLAIAAALALVRGAPAKAEGKAA